MSTKEYKDFCKVVTSLGKWKRNLEELLTLRTVGYSIILQEMECFWVGWRYNHVFIG